MQEYVKWKYLLYVFASSTTEISYSFDGDFLHYRSFFINLSLLASRSLNPTSS